MTTTCPNCAAKARVYTTKIVRGATARYYRCPMGHNYSTREIVQAVPIQPAPGAGTTNLVPPTPTTAPQEPVSTTNIVQAEADMVRAYEDQMAEQLEGNP